MCAEEHHLTGWPPFKSSQVKCKFMVCVGRQGGTWLANKRMIVQLIIGCIISQNVRCSDGSPLYCYRTGKCIQDFRHVTADSPLIFYTKWDQCDFVRPAFVLTRTLPDWTLVLAWRCVQHGVSISVGGLRMSREGYAYMEISGCAVSRAYMQ